MIDCGGDGSAGAGSSGSLRIVESGWSDRYRDVVAGPAAPHDMGQYVGREERATRILSYEPDLIPGLLQVSEYARAVARAFFPETTEAERDRFVASRIDRTKLLDRDAAPEFAVLIGEAALRRSLESPKAHRRQLDSLAHDLDGSRKHVGVGIVPLHAAVPAAWGGSFVLMSFDDGAGDLVCRESISGSRYLTSQADVERAGRAYEDLSKVALSRTAAQELVREIAAALR